VPLLRFDGSVDVAVNPVRAQTRDDAVSIQRRVDHRFHACQPQGDPGITCQCEDVGRIAGWVATEMSHISDSPMPIGTPAKRGSGS
jgi:hypothetical protein